MEIGSDGVQLLGGHGFVKEHPVERWYRDLRAAGVMEGALLVYRRPPPSATTHERKHTMINLEIPKKFKPLASQAHQVATEVFRPISRKYDEAEHAYPKELDMLASLIDGMNEASEHGAAGAAGVRREQPTATAARTATAPTSPPCSASSSSAGATSACC